MTGLGRPIKSRPGRLADFPEAGLAGCVMLAYPGRLFAAIPFPTQMDEKGKGQRLAPGQAPAGPKAFRLEAAGQNQNNDDDQNDPENADAAMAETIAVTAKAAAEAAEQEDDEQDDEDGANGHDFFLLAGSVRPIPVMVIL